MEWPDACKERADTRELTHSGDAGHRASGWMFGRCLSLRKRQPHQQQHAVAGVHGRMQESMAELPVIPATMNFVVAIATFAAIAP
jgi:hypothetical protein